MGAVARRCVGSAARCQASADPAVPRPVQHDVLLGVTTPSPQPSSRAPHTSAAAPSSAACCPPALLQSSPASADLPHLLKPARPLEVELNQQPAPVALAVSGGSPAVSAGATTLPACLPAVWQVCRGDLTVESPISPACHLKDFCSIRVLEILSPDQKCEDFSICVRICMLSLRCCLPLSPHLGPPFACSLAAPAAGLVPSVDG